MLGRKGEAYLTADTPFAVKKIHYTEQGTFMFRKWRNIRYYGEDGERDCHTLYNPLDMAVGEQTKEIPAGYEWVGYSLTLDDEGYIVWANPLLWPTGTAIMK